MHLCLADLDAADFHVHATRQIFETLGLNDAYKTHHTLSQIAEAWGDSAAAAEWAQKRDAKPAELKGVAGGSGSLPGETPRPASSYTFDSCLLFIHMG